MQRDFSKFSSYALGIGFLFLSLLLAGCPKKVKPVGGSAGVSDEKPSEQSAATAPDRAPSGSSPREEAVPSTPRGEEPPSSSPEERLSPLAKQDRSTGGQERERAEAKGSSDAGALQDVFFDFDRWVIRSEARKVLEQNAQWLTRNQSAKIEIEGHSDERGTNEYNLALGERRAKSAMNFLVNLGVSPSQISVISYGEEKPFCEDRDESCYQKNRRAHFAIK